MNIPLLHRYLLREFFTAFFVCLLIAVSVFVAFDFFENTRLFLREGSTFTDAFGYIFFKIPVIIHLMTPIAVLVAVLVSIGRLSQGSEITAMRSCGSSILSLSLPLISAGMVISIFVFIIGETLVPWSAQRSEEIYQLDIKKKAEKGGFSRLNYWFRSEDKFYHVGLYNSQLKTLHDLTILELSSLFEVNKRLDAPIVKWIEPYIGWTMEDIIESRFSQTEKLSNETFSQLPLVIKETPQDFYNYNREPETMTYRELKAYIAKLKNDGIPVTRYLVDLAAKLSFPLVNMIVILVAVPFALTPARSGSMTSSFIAGVTLGFGYHFIHAMSTSLGGAELIPIIPAAWAANVILGCIGGYLLFGAEIAH